MLYQYATYRCGTARLSADYNLKRSQVIFSFHPSSTTSSFNLNLYLQFKQTHLTIKLKLYSQIK